PTATLKTVRSPKPTASTNVFVVHSFPTSARRVPGDCFSGTPRDDAIRMPPPGKRGLLAARHASSLARTAIASGKAPAVNRDAIANAPAEIMSARRLIVPANGLAFEVFEAGEGERLALMLHGFPQHAVSFRHQLPFLAGLGYRVWAVNQRGYGGSSRPRDRAA